MGRKDGLRACASRKRHLDRNGGSGWLDGEAGRLDRRMFGLAAEAVGGLQGPNPAHIAESFHRLCGTGPMQGRHAARV